MQGEQHGLYIIHHRYTIHIISAIQICFFSTLWPITRLIAPTLCPYPWEWLMLYCEAQACYLPWPEHQQWTWTLWWLCWGEAPPITFSKAVIHLGWKHSQLTTHGYLQGPFDQSTKGSYWYAVGVIDDNSGRDSWVIRVTLLRKSKISSPNLRQTMDEKSRSFILTKEGNSLMQSYKTG